MSPDVTVLSTDVLTQGPVLLAHPVGVPTGPAGRRVVVVMARGGSHRRGPSQHGDAEQSGGDSCCGDRGFGDCGGHRVWCVGGVCLGHSHHRVGGHRPTSPERGIQAHNPSFGGLDALLRRPLHRSPFRSVQGAEWMVWWRRFRITHASERKLNFRY